MTEKSDFATFGLSVLGWTHLNEEEKKQYFIAFRLAPGIVLAFSIVGLISQSYVWFGVLALIKLLGAAHPKGHIGDIFYNSALRHVFGTLPLPPSEAPKRFANFIAFLFTSTIAIAFYLNLPTLGSVLGIFVCIVAFATTASGFCTAAWVYGLFKKSSKN